LFVTVRRVVALIVLWIGSAATATLLAQSGRPPAPVRYTTARLHQVRGEVTLPGTVTARTSSVVASEVAGMVTHLLVREGESVRRGQSIARLRQQTLELRLAQLEAELKEAQARLDLADRSLGRSRELHDSGVVSQQQLDDAVSESEAWQGRVDSAQAQIDRLEDDLERSRIPAPFAGVVVAEHVDVGEWLDVGGAVVEMVSLDDLEVVTALPERYFERLTKGTAVRLTFEALPGFVVEGEVSAIIPQADRQSRTFPVKVRVANPEGRIAVGMLARLAFAAGSEHDAIIVPKDAIVARMGSSLVFVIDSDNTIATKTVTTGAGVGGWIVVEEGLAEGERVVVRGNERLRPGQTVQAEEEEYELP
jgi:RND family efflux transporter MFP subunit